jgi:hypothetical protein
MNSNLSEQMRKGMEGVVTEKERFDEDRLVREEGLEKVFDGGFLVNLENGKIDVIEDEIKK